MLAGRHAPLSVLAALALLAPLVKIDGVWGAAPRNWTDMPVVTFCRDLKAERVEEMILIWSNARLPDVASGRTDPLGEFPALWVSNVGCWRWKGSVDVVTTEPGLRYELHTDVTYERVPPRAGPFSAAMPLGFRAVEGEMRFREEGRSGDCTSTGDGAAALNPEASPMSSFSYLLSGPFHRKIGFVPHSGPGALTTVIDCGAGREPRTHQGSGGPPTPVEVSPDGGLVADSASVGGNTTITWRLEAQRE